MSYDARDLNNDGKVSLMEKVKDKLHLGHKDNETYTSTHNTTSSTHHAAVLPATHTTTAALPAVAAVPAMAMAPVATMPLATSTIQTSSAYDSRDLNRDGHLSMGEKLATATLLLLALLTLPVDLLTILET